MRTLVFLLLPFLLPPTIRAGAFEFKTGDRIILLGGTIIEREQKFGFLETQLALALGEKQVSMRNLGWSGDTVFGTARSYFGPPAEGIERLTKHLEMIKPTVLIACYGHDVALDRDLKIEDFIAGYEALLNLVRSKGENLRVIIIAPPSFENLGAPLPSMDDANAKLVKINDALSGLAKKQNATFIDTYQLRGGSDKSQRVPPLTDNGLHYGEAGYKLWSEKVISGLGLKSPQVATAETDALRKAVIRKDFLFFNRWRPANDTYLFGFRKHEQGRNAVEMEQFDPIVADQEKKIAELKSTALAAHRVP